jgi:hypothetical protein
MDIIESKSSLKAFFASLGGSISSTFYADPESVKNILFKPFAKCYRQNKRKLGEKVGNSNFNFLLK